MKLLGAVAVALMIVAAGLAVPPPPAPAPATDAPDPGPSRLEQAVEAWDFSGFSGNLSWSNASIGWIDIVLPQTDNTTVEAYTRLGWPATDDDGDQTNWVCRYSGLVAHPRRYDAFGFGGCVGGVQNTNDTTVTLKTRSDRERVGAEDMPVPMSPLSTVSGGLSGHMKYTSELNLTEGAGRPVEHYTIFLGGGPLQTFKMTLNYTNTTPRVRMGPQSDTFAYTISDFDATVGASVDTPLGYGPATSSVATLETEMVRHNPSTVWTAWGQTETGGETINISRPDGSQVQTDFWMEATRMQGPWRFRVDDHTTYHGGNAPVLMGASYRRAAFPWQSPIFE